MPKNSRNRSRSKPAQPRKRALVDYEVEIKLPCDELTRLTESGLALERTRAKHFEDNWVFKLPDGKLRKGQYLRVRHTGNGDGAGRRHAGVLTYKGKSRRTSADAKGKYKGKKVREEVETAVGQPAKTVKILKRLGFQRSFRYQKWRTCFVVRLDDGRTIQAMFDETPIGNFIELEGDAAAIETVAHQLGYPSSAFISESYVEMQVARCAGKGEPLSDMVFPKPKRQRKAHLRKSAPDSESSADSPKPKAASKSKAKDATKAASGLRKRSRRGKSGRRHHEADASPVLPDDVKSAESSEPEAISSGAAAG